MKLQKGVGLFGDMVYRVTARAPDGHVWCVAVYARVDAPDRKGVADALWQARRVLRAELLNRGFWKPGDEGMAA